MKCTLLSVFASTYCCCCIQRRVLCLCNLPEVTLPEKLRRVQSRCATCKYSASRDIWLVFSPPTIYAAHSRAKYVTSPFSNGTYCVDPCSCHTELDYMHARKSTECKNALCVQSMYFTLVSATLCAKYLAWGIRKWKSLKAWGFSLAHASQPACVMIHLTNQNVQI